MILRENFDMRNGVKIFLDLVDLLDSTKITINNSMNKELYLTLYEYIIKKKL